MPKDLLRVWVWLGLGLFIYYYKKHQKIGVGIWLGLGLGSTVHLVYWSAPLDHYKKNVKGFA